jgi:hypothetical protein
VNAGRSVREISALPLPPRLNAHSSPRATASRARPEDRPGLGAPNPAAPRLRHAVCQSEGPAADGVRQRRPYRRAVGDLGRQRTTPATPQGDRRRPSVPQEDDLGLIRDRRRHRRDLAAVAHHPGLVAGHRGTHPDPRHTETRTEAANTGIKQIKRTGRDTEIPPTIKLVSCSPAPPDARREPIDQARHHGQLQIATCARPSRVVQGAGV